MAAMRAKGETIITNNDTIARQRIVMLLTGKSSASLCLSHRVSALGTPSGLTSGVPADHVSFLS